MIWVLASCHAPNRDASDTHDTWQALSLDGEKIGYRQLRSEQRNGAIITQEKMVVTFQQPGTVARESVTTLTFRESPTGEPLSMEKTLSSNSANHRLFAAREDGKWQVRADDADEPLLEATIPTPFLLRAGLRQALQAQQGDTRSLNYYSWSFAKLEFVRYHLEAVRTRSPDPQRRWLMRRWQTDAPSDITESYADRQFRVTEEYAPTSAGELSSIACDRDCALSPFTPITHVYRHVIRSPYRIHDGALRGTIRYQLQDTGPLAPPNTDEQRVTRNDSGLEITVCRDCGSEAPATVDALSQGLESNYWLDASHPDIVQVINEQLPDRSLSPTLAMTRLTRFVTQHMDDVADYRGYATAVEALHNRSGDCTEHALLLATLGRAAGIPTRVALGLAYNNERFLGRRFVFVPHAWVQAWVGDRWLSFDSGLGEFNAGYITLGLSQGEQAAILAVNKQLHRLKITSAVQIKDRQ